MSLIRPENAGDSDARRIDHSGSVFFRGSRLRQIETMPLRKPSIRRSFGLAGLARVRGWRLGHRSARPTLSLSQHLGLLTLVVALPLIVVSFFMVGRFADSERQARRAFLVAAAHSLGDAVETELDKYFVMSNALAHSRSLLEGDLTGFGRTASEMLASLPDAALAISTPEGGTLLDTRRLVEGGSHPGDRTARQEPMLAAGSPVLSAIEVAASAPHASVDTPLLRDGKPVYVMTLSFSSRGLGELLQGQKYPAGWIAAVLDRSGRFVARVPQGEGRPGESASGSFRTALQSAPEGGIVDNVSLEGDPVISAYTRTGYGWTVAVSAQAEVLDESLSRALWLLSLLAAGSLAVSLALAFFANRRLAFGVRSLQGAAKNIGQGKPVAFKMTGVREFDELSLAFAEASSLLHERAVQRQTAEAERSASEERFRVLADSLPQLVWTARPDGRVDYTNARRERYGNTGLTRTDWDGVIHPDDLRATVAAWLKASETGDPYEMEHRLMVTGKGFTWHLSRASLLRDASGKPVKWYGTTMDIHEHKMREEHIRILMTEVNHRSKNLLAVTQAIARQTVSSSATAAEFEQKFSGRLLGLAASQDLLTDQKWGGVRLEALVRSQTGRYSDIGVGRVAIAGPETLLNSTATQAIGMALHELATNAARHGALSNDAGHVEVHWRVEDAELAVDWTERNGPAVREQPKRGFGSIVIEEMLAQRLNAVVRFSFDAGGIRWRLRVPLKNVAASEAPAE
jgi:PAS domain S-box-containing protein